MNTLLIWLKLRPNYPTINGKILHRGDKIMLYYKWAMFLGWVWIKKKWCAVFVSKNKTYIIDGELLQHIKDN